MDLYVAKYTTSHALIVGINKYGKISPLSYAVNDAKGVAKLLVSQFGFKSENTDILLDDKATKQNIIRAFLGYATDKCSPNDRLIFFFAGHGYTRPGRRQEVGFLVPVDGNIDDLSTLIRWDDLTRNAELIPAKHVLFIMDACYGGLALTRSIAPGSVRFLRDMLQRFSRQVITAGKANEVVADSGGPLQDHSVFTGHLIEGLNGKAETPDGILTANGIMSYVYERVAKDPNSQQTPHYGFIDGDGDFIFKGIPEDPDVGQSKEDKDKLVSVPATAPETSGDDLHLLVKRTKDFLGENRFLIPLHDLFVDETRWFLAQTADDFFTVQDQWSPDKFRERIKRYERISLRLQATISCISYWGLDEHRLVLEKTMSRLTDRLQSKSGLVAWLVLRWYPVLLLTYYGGIAAVAAGKYRNLASLLGVRAPSEHSLSKESPLSLVLADVLSEMQNAFKTLPGYERNYTPRSEYMFKLVQPLLDDLLFLGRDYENCFDRFEILFALACADKREENYGETWGPFGRFTWKYHSRFSTTNTFRQILQEAKTEQVNWGPIKAGLFQGSYTRFVKVASEYEKIIRQLNWR